MYITQYFVSRKQAQCCSTSGLRNGVKILGNAIQQGLKGLMSLITNFTLQAHRCPVTLHTQKRKRDSLTAKESENTIFSKDDISL